jgi:hypothetical protein
VLAVIGAVAALADAAERLRLLREMRETPLTVTPPASVPCSTRSRFAATVAEPVQRKRTRAIVDVSNRVFDTIVADDREQRPEDLLARDRGPFAGVDGRASGAILRVAGSSFSPAGLISTTFGARGARVLDQSAEARVVPVADDARVVAIAGKRRVEPRHRAPHRRDEFVDARAGHQRVIRRDARLTGVEQLADRDHRRDLREIAVGRRR